VLALRGETATATSVLRDGLSQSKLHWRDDLIGAYGGDLETICAGTLANMLLVSGHADEALPVLDDAVRVAERRHPAAKVGMLYSAALFHQARNEPERALSFAIALRQAAASHQLSHYALLPRRSAVGGSPQQGRQTRAPRL